MSIKNIENWHPEQLLRHVCHELTQDIANASGCVDVLLLEEETTNLTEEQKKLLFMLKNKIDNIWALDDILRFWAKNKYKLSHDDFDHEIQIFSNALIECIRNRNKE